MSRHKRLDALIAAAGATVLAGAALVLSPQPSHAGDPATSVGFPTGRCSDTDLSSRLASQSAVIDAPLIQLAHQRIARLGQQNQTLTRW
jgi:hypothetical protein